MVESNNAEQALALQPIILFLQPYVPFSHMSRDDLEYLARNLELAFYATGESILTPEQGPADRLCIIKQGRVVGGPRKEGTRDMDSAWELLAGDCFPVGALVSRRPVNTIHSAAEDTFVYEMSREVFEAIIERSPQFHDFCTRRLASLLDKYLSHAQATSAAASSEHLPMTAPIHSLIRKQPVTCTVDTPIRGALERLHNERVGSIVIVDNEMRPRGILTLHDVLSRVALAQQDIDAPVSTVLTSDPMSLPPDAPAHEAALLMTKIGFGHICVVDNGRLVGVVSERDLFSLQRISLVTLSRTITSAETVDDLVQHAAAIQRLVQQMLAQGVAVEQIMRIITTLNDHLTQRIIVLVENELGKPTVPYTWLSFGSEGRYEQTLVTDQDNGILFASDEPEKDRELLLPFARRINEALDQCGFPLCQGNIMASNPKCCRTAEEWRDRFGSWINGGTPEHLLNANIFFDFRTLYGPEEPVNEARVWILERTGKSQRFLRMMAENALSARPPLGMVREFITSAAKGYPKAIDLKANGLRPFVDGARLLSLAHGIAETSTLGRLRACASQQVLPEGDVDSLIEAYTFIQLLRIRHQEERRAAGLPGDNYIDPSTLNDLDRRILREAFRQARKLQSRIALDYQL